MIKGQKFIVLGRAGMDVYPSNRGKIRESQGLDAVLGGSSGNIAAGIARLGGEVDILTAVSDDPVGDFVRQQCANYNIGTQHLHSAPRGTSTSLAFAENRLDDFEVVVYRNNAADLYLEMDDIDRVDFSAYNALIVTGTALSAEPSRATTLEAMRRADCAIIDLDYRINAWTSEKDAQAAFQEAAELADIVIGNDVEFSVLGGALDLAREIGRTKTVVYKMGERGATTIQNSTAFSTPIFKVEALKPVGAGDAFMAGFVMALGSGKPIETAVSEGAANAAIVVTRPACAPAMPTRRELDQFLNERL